MVDIRVAQCLRYTRMMKSRVERIEMEKFNVREVKLCDK